MKTKKSRIFACLLAAATTFGSIGAYTAENTEIPTSIQWLQAVGFLNGDADRNLRLDDKITRAETTALIIRALGETAGEGSTAFSDMSDSHWAYGYVGCAAELGIINGYPDGTFHPENTVLYEEFLKMLIRIVSTKTDLEYPLGYINEAKNTGLLDEIDAAAGQPLTRGIVAEIFANAFDMTISKTGKTIRETYLESAETDSSDRIDDDSDYASLDGVALESPSVAWAGEPAVSGGSGSGGGGGSYAESSTAAGGYPAPGMPPTGRPEPIVPMPDGQQLPPPDPGQLTAGCWSDHDNWSFWRELMANEKYYDLQSKWGISTERREVKVVTENGEPAWDAQVSLLDENGGVVWQSRTDKDGIAYVFIAPQTDYGVLTVTAKTADGDEVSAELGTEPVTLTLSDFAEPDGLDLMLMVDTTGSMGDELRYLKEELKDVVQKIDTPVRISCNFYRDFGDRYIVRPFAFTDDIDLAVEQISRQNAAGGGDYEEAVDLALIDGVEQHNWSDSAKTRIMFLVLDAPPHFTHKTAANMRAVAKAASEKGIHIIPVASSGVNKNTEFLLRTMAVVTNSEYIFLTDDSGIGLSHIEPTIGQYEVEYLNDLMLSIIKKYIGQE